MGFPENVLTDNEKVEQSLHPHWMTVLVPSILAVVLIAIAIVIAVVTPNTSGWNIVQWVVVGLAAIGFIILCLVPFLRWRTTHYVITDKRVMVRRGILSKSGKDIGLSKITDVSFHQSLLDRIIRAGSLHIESAGDSPDEDLDNIPRSNEVQQFLNHLVEQDQNRHGMAGGMPVPEQQSRLPAPTSAPEQPYERYEPYEAYERTVRDDPAQGWEARP